MKRRLTLQLNIYLKHGDKACLVFKKEELLYRINNLLDPAFFVASMAQLEKSVGSGAGQYCHYVLNATRGRAWLLNVIHEQDTINVELLCRGAVVESPASVFSWAGSPDAFRYALRGLAAAYQLSRMSGYYKR